MNDDTVYYEPVEGEEALSTEDTWVQEVPAVQEEEQYPVNRRRSRSVGSRPLFLRKPEASSHQQYKLLTFTVYMFYYILHPSL